MITFSCENCGKSFTVADGYAGRSARCKNCDATVTVPLVSTAPQPPLAPAKPTMRIRRLRSDSAAMAEAFKNSPLIRVYPSPGDPPEFYQVEYSVKGLELPSGDDPTPRQEHRVEIQLTADYPRVSPKCKMLTPIFHPNIDAASICVGDHWTAGERLTDLVVRIGEMIAFQAYNIKSPLNAQAAMWADLHATELPVDSRNLRPPEMQ
jgi:ubiquitin-protein ligase